MLETYISEIFTVFNDIKATVIIFGPELISATNAAQDVFAIQYAEQIITKMPFTSMCTRDRISEFNNRIKQWDDVAMDFKTTNGEVMEVVFSSKKSKAKINFKCMKKSVIMGAERSFQDVSLNVAREIPPKRLKVDPEFKLIMDASEIATLSDGNRMMKSEFVTINSDKGKAEVILTSDNGERMNIDIDVPVIQVGSKDSTFSYRYRADNFLNLVKRYGTDGIVLCSHGVVRMQTPHVAIYIAPIKNVV